MSEYHEGVARGIHGAIRWDDGTDSQLAYARYVNGRERHAVRVELDGVRYVPARRGDYDTEVMNA